MRALAPDQVVVLRDLRRVWPEDKFVVIGATAVGFHLDFCWRTTRDLDLSIAADIEECQEALENRPGWIRHERILHAWTAPGGVRVDIVPASVKALEVGRIDWPDGSTMSAVGLRAAFVDAVCVDVGDETIVRVASAAAITILKMAASLDRLDRERDLADIAHMIEGSIAHDDEERWSNEILDRNMDYDLVGPFLLGRRVGVLADERERAVVDRFFKRLDDPADRSASLGRMMRNAPIAWREEEVALTRLCAFRYGFES